MITIVKADGWTAFYKDGRLVDQTHSFRPESILGMAGVECEVKWAEDYLIEHGWAPDDLSEVVFDED